MILACILILVSSVGITFLVRHFALRKNILDIPNERSSHLTPTPRGGGIAIVLSFSLACIGLGLTGTIPVNLVYTLAGGGLIIGLMGFYDDMYGVRNRYRIIIHFLIAIWAVYWLGGFHILDLGTWKVILKNRGSLLAVVGTVWLINLYNFMDGVDGLAGSEGLFTALASGTALWVLGFPNYSAVMFLLAASIAGFTLLNWPPAKIFLGDVGSGYLGYVFAVFGIAMANADALPITFWLIILGVFIYDATFTVVYRAWKGQRVYTAHREHAYQHLHMYGASHKQISIAILFINLCLLLPIAFAALNWPQHAFWFLSGIISSLLCMWLAIKKLPIEVEVKYEANSPITENRQDHIG